MEREKLKNACEFLRDLALSEFLYASGLRVSEVASLDIDNIDFITKEASVIGKGAKERRFYLSEVCAEYLQQYLKSRTDNNPALFVAVKSPYKRLGKEGIEAAVKRIGRKAGVENVHPHRFRRTLATDLAVSYTHLDVYKRQGSQEPSERWQKQLAFRRKKPITWVQP